MIKSILTVMIPIVLLQSCDKSDDIEYLETITSVKTVEIPDSVNIGETFSISLIIHGSSGCSEYSRFETDRISDTTDFIIYQKRNKDQICTAQTIEIPRNISTSFNSPGMNYLRFTQVKGEDLIDSIFVKN